MYLVLCSLHGHGVVFCFILILQYPAEQDLGPAGILWHDCNTNNKPSYGRNCGIAPGEVSLFLANNMCWPWGGQLYVLSRTTHIFHLIYQETSYCSFFTDTKIVAESFLLLNWWFSAFLDLRYCFITLNWVVPDFFLFKGQALRVRGLVREGQVWACTYLLISSYFCFPFHTSRHTSKICWLPGCESLFLMHERSGCNLSVSLVHLFSNFRIRVPSSTFLNLVCLVENHCCAASTFLWFSNGVSHCNW